VAGPVPARRTPSGKWLRGERQSHRMHRTGSRSRLPGQTTPRPHLTPAEPDNVGAVPERPANRLKSVTPNSDSQGRKPRGRPRSRQEAFGGKAMGPASRGSEPPCSLQSGTASKRETNIYVYFFYKIKSIAPEELDQRASLTQAQGICGLRTSLETPASISESHFVSHGGKDHGKRSPNGSAATPKIFVFYAKLCIDLGKTFFFLLSAVSSYQHL